MSCADFAQFSAQFFYTEDFAQIFAIARIFAQEINFRQRQNFSDWSSEGNSFSRVDLVFGSKYVQFCKIFSLQYSIIISTFWVDPHSD